jgi:putative endonuclease
MKYYVYVLQSKKDSSLYKGLTDNLERRMRQHSDGKCKSTINKRPLELIRVEHFDNRKDAREREKYYKSGIGREELKKLF